MNFYALTYSRIQQTEKKISAFRQLQVGWHYGGGIPPKPEVIHKALTLNVEAERVGFTKTNAFLGVEGEIRVTAYQGQLYLELTVEPDETVTFVAEQNGSELAYEENLDFDGALTRIRSFRGTTWASSGLFTSATTTKILDVSKALPSNHLAMVAEYLSLMKIASYEQAKASANISKGTTKTVRELPLYSGTSIPKYFLQSAVLSK